MEDQPLPEAVIVYSQPYQRSHRLRRPQHSLAHAIALTNHEEAGTSVERHVPRCAVQADRRIRAVGLSDEPVQGPRGKAPSLPSGMDRDVDQAPVRALPLVQQQPPHEETIGEQPVVERTRWLRGRTGALLNLHKHLVKSQLGAGHR